ncbi:hypothetical protein EPD60_03690 [Flaviaesturariibacter flavus]|uniref:DUF2975 domain-containing protein n=1 Tax=Flaviaesturariibacter flavus TaxID=2502780 RepID=A0A4R1BMF5_9BACT|nr:hypothetical protein [Flaviaesturariibacter flavus]TCJ18614.1 hypothetical protein EPD60_03690 [Flaviaesturariibacter flavus]
MFPRLHNHHSPFNKFFRLAVYGFFFIVIVIAFVSVVGDSEESMPIAVRPASNFQPNQKEYPGANIFPTGELTVVNPSFLQRLLVPGKLDPLRVLWGIGVLIIGFVFFRNYKVAQPFTREALTGLRVLMFFCGFFVVLDLARSYWFLQLVRGLTANQYTLDNHLHLGSLSGIPAFWVLMGLIRLNQVFRKGYQLTLDQQYTV